jgi:hypothetical protein
LNYLPSAFIPKALFNIMQKAGLLTYSRCDSLPIPSLRDSGKRYRKALKELTAAGTVPDFHGIPYYDAASGKEALCTCCGGKCMK